MLNCSSEILKEITDYLASRHILYRAYAPVGIVTFSAGTLNTENLYDYRVNIGKTDFRVETAAPIKIPDHEKIYVRLLKFCNSVNLADRSGGYLVLNRAAGTLCCHMTVPFSSDSCGRIDRLLPIPACMLNRCSGAVRQLILGTSSVEREVSSLKNACIYRDIFPLVSSSCHNA